jgi:hypothetical protein
MRLQVMFILLILQSFRRLLQVNYTTMCHGLDQTGEEQFVYVDFLYLKEAI